MTRLAFTADLHVDEYGTRRDPETGLNARLVDYLRTLRWVAVEAGLRGSDALVIAGDFTERRHPAPWLVSKIVDAIAEGAEERILVRGNHDGEIAGGSIVSVLGNAVGHDHAFTRPGIAWIRRTAIACIPYLDRHWLRAQPGFESVPDSQIFQALAEQYLTIARGLFVQAEREHPDHEGIVLVGHQALAGAAMSETQRAFLGDQSLVVDARALADIGFEACVFGHLHRHQVVVPGDRPVLYAGSIERVDFGEELEAKGFIVADVGRGRFAWEFVRTPARRFLTLSGENVDTMPPSHLADAIVRVVDVGPSADVVGIRAHLEGLGAFSVAEIRRQSVSRETIAGLPETLTAEQALEEYFAGEPDRELLLERGHEILVEVAA